MHVKSMYKKLYAQIFKWFSDANRSMATFTAILAISSIFATVFTSYILDVQTNLSREQLVGTLGAILRLDTSMDFRGLQISFEQFHDFPAKNLNVNVEMAELSFPSEVVVGQDIHKHFEQPIESQDNGFSTLIIVPWPIVLHADSFKGDWPGNFVVRFIVSFSYDNGFGENVAETSCQIWTPPVNITVFCEGGTYGTLLPCSDFDLHVEKIQQEIKNSSKKL